MTRLLSMKHLLPLNEIGGQTIKNIIWDRFTNAHTHYGCCCRFFYFQKEKEEEVTEEFLDWWSKFYASIGDVEKSGEYINKGYEKMAVSLRFLICNSNIKFSTELFSVLIDYQSRSYCPVFLAMINES